MQEAKLSSEIENIVTTNDELYRAFTSRDHQVSLDTKEVLHYHDALWHGYFALKSKKRLLTTTLFEELCTILIGSETVVRRTSGTKLATPSGEIIYTPPEGEAVIRDKLANLEHYIYARDSVDPLIKLAVIHYQFEAIHPFHDGNGRTGRILNILYLVEKGTLESPSLLSRYFMEQRSKYYSGLRSITEQAKWED